MSRSATSGRDFLVALSWANLLFLPVWLELLYMDPGQYYYLEVLPSKDSFIAIMANVLVFAGLFCAVVFALRRIQSRAAWRIAKTIGLLLLIIPLAAVIPQITKTSSAIYDSWIFPLVGKWGGLILALAVGFLAIRFLVLYRRNLWKYGVGLILLLAPFALITFGQAIWAIAGQGPAAPPKAAVSPVSPAVGVDLPKSAQGKTRILWIVLDEVDQRLTFEERPKDILMPSFDRLRREAIVATQAMPPSGRTRDSLPSLLSGRLVDKAAPVDSSELLLQYADGTEARWSGQDNIFREARSRGYKTAMVGWYHPYGRVLGQYLDESMSTGSALTRFSTAGVWANMKSEFLGILPLINRVQYMENMQALNEKTVQLAANRDYGLVFCHLPGLHAPFVYDRQTNQYTLYRDDVTGYFDHMVLADITLGRIRAEMERGGLWEDTLVIVSSDHWWRISAQYDGKTDKRIPFIIKMPGQKNGIAYDKPVQTSLTYPLLLAVMNGEVKSAEEAVRWMEKQQ